MAINPRTVTGNFQDAVFDAISVHEGFVPRVYSDPKGVPTLGYGFALVTYSGGTGGTLKRREDLDQWLDGIVTLTSGDEALLSNIVRTLNESDPAVTTPAELAAIRAIIPGPGSTAINPMSFAITAEQGRELFDRVMWGYEVGGGPHLPGFAEQLLAKLGDSLYDSLDDSYEKVALLSLAYNGGVGIIGERLLGALALQSGNRAAAWYEIRYQSNGDELGGIAKRRYLESSLFGLYNDPANVSDSEARQVLDVFLGDTNTTDGHASNRRQMWAYDTQYRDNFDAANTGDDMVAVRALIAGGEVVSLRRLFLPIADYIARTYAPGVATDTGNINGEVLLGPASSTEDHWLIRPKNSNPEGQRNDLLVGLIGGENTLDGMDGDDILIGGDQSDTLIGGAGADVLLGGSGGDVYEALGDGDIAVDVSGHDTYRLTGLGQVTIADTDGQGAVEWAGVALTGGTELVTGAKGAGALWRSADGTVTYLRADGDLLVHRAGQSGVVTLQGHDFERGALGLVLAGPAAPAGIAIPLTEEADTVTGVDGWALHGLTLDMAARQTIRAYGGADDLDVDPYHFPGVVVHAGAGNDFVSAGWDRAIEPDGYPQPAASDGVTLFGDGGNDVLAGSNADDTLVGGDESVGPEPDNDLLEGFGGNDVLSGGAGADWLLGGGGDDIFAGGSGADMLWGAQGADRIYGGSEDDRLYGDTLGSYLRWNQVLGGPDPEAFRDLAYFHAGDYYLHEDIPAADSGNDFLAGGLGDDHLYGGAGDDVLEGGDDNDVLHGESGDDVLRGGAGKDWLYGDVRAADREADAAVVARFSVTGVGEVVWHQRRHLDLEEVEGNDYLDGGPDSDILHGGAGDDTLLGGTDVAIDYLHGEAGDDFLDGGPGNDNLEGGGDNDTYRFGADFGNDHLYDSSGVDTIRFAQARGEFGLVRLGRDLLFTHRDGSVQVRDWFGAGAIERVEFAGEAVSGAELNAVVLTQQGGDGGDILDGLDGYADTISGGAGDDRITLGSGDDIADGGPGNDNIVAGPGNDILRAGGGNDRLVGGPGADRYELATGNVTIVDDPADGAVNTVRLGAGVTAAQVAAMRVGDDLRLLIPQGEVTISDYHLAPETFRFEDGAGVVFAPANVRVAVPDATFLAHYRNGTLARARAAMATANGAGNRTTGHETVTRTESWVASIGSGLGTVTVSPPAGPLGVDDYNYLAGKGVDLLGASEDSLRAAYAGHRQLDLLNATMGSAGGGVTHRLDWDYPNVVIDRTTYRETASLADRAVSTVTETGLARYALAVRRPSHVTVDTESLHQRETKYWVGAVDFATAAAQPSPAYEIIGQGTFAGTVALPELTRPATVTTTLRPFYNVTLGAGDDDVAVPGSPLASVVDGGAGDDIISTGNDGDFLAGGEGRDQLYGFEGRQTFAGGPGSDRLEGGFAADTYLIGRQEGGVDVIADDGFFIDEDEYILISYSSLGDGSFEDWYNPDNAVVRDNLNALYHGDDTAFWNAVSEQLEGDGTIGVSGEFGLSLPPPVIDEARFNLLLGEVDVHRIDYPAAVPSGDVELQPALLLAWGPAGERNGAVILEHSDLRMPGYGIERYVFEDATLTRAQMHARVVTGDAGLMLDFVGTGGDDWLPGSSVADRMDGGDGLDSIYGAGGDDHILGGAGEDVLEGGAGDDHLYGGPDYDELYGQDGDDYLDGGAGDDYLLGGAGDDVLTDTEGNNGLEGGDGNDHLIGGDGADSLDGGNGNDRLEGGAGDDIYSFGLGYAFVTGGTDVIHDGGGDHDVVSISSESPLAMTDLRAANDGTDLWIDIGATQRITIEGWYAGSEHRIEHFEFSSYDWDRMTWVTWSLGAAEVETLATPIIAGDGGNNVLVGTDRAEMFLAGPGDDVILGGGGNDVLDGQAGADLLDGGPGDDVLRFGGDGQWENRGYAVNVGSPGAPRAREYRPIGRRNRSLDVYIGGDGYDRLVGTAGDDAVFLDDALSLRPAGTSGARLIGIEAYAVDAGNDIVDLTSLRYASGNVWIDGGAGDDILWANSGNDLIDGGSGTDRLDGGVGNDLLVGGPGSDHIATGRGRDVILFNRGDGMDTVVSGDGPDNTLSVGGGIEYDELYLSRNGNHLVLEGAAGDAVTFENWYAKAMNRSVRTLQVIAAAMPGYDAQGADPLLDQRVESFDFGGLVSAFDQARVDNPGLGRWALTHALTALHLGGSDSEAMGGDLAWRYGMTGVLGGSDLAAVHGVLASPQFGGVPQPFSAPAGMRTGAQVTV